ATSLPRPAAAVVTPGSAPAPAAPAPAAAIDWAAMPAEGWAAKTSAPRATTSLVPAAELDNAVNTPVPNVEASARRTRARSRAFGLSAFRARSIKDAASGVMLVSFQYAHADAPAPSRNRGAPPASASRLCSDSPKAPRQRRGSSSARARPSRTRPACLHPVDRADDARAHALLPVQSLRQDRARDNGVRDLPAVQPHDARPCGDGCGRPAPRFRTTRSSTTSDP